MNFWFQNLNENKKQLFAFRGSVGRDWNKTWFSYEFSSGRNLALKYTHGDDDGLPSRLRLGLGFFTIYLSFSLPKSWYFKRKCIATWDNNREFWITDEREYGFYFYRWAFVWSWHKRPHESSRRDPWWSSAYIHIDDLILGKPECLTDELGSIEDVFFEVGEKEFKMDKIKWDKTRRFRRRIPYSLFHRTFYGVQMEIENPPMIAGKGENSWDIDDDGSFGMSAPWDGPRVTWKNRDECAEIAVRYYVNSALKDARRYGSGSGDRGISRDDSFQYIGRKTKEGE